MPSQFNFSTNRQMMTESKEGDEVYDQVPATINVCNNIALPLCDLGWYIYIYSHNASHV